MDVNLKKPEDCDDLLHVAIYIVYWSVIVLVLSWETGTWFSIEIIQNGLYCMDTACILLVSAPDPNHPSMDRFQLDAIRAGVGLGLGPRLAYCMVWQPWPNIP